MVILRESPNERRLRRDARAIFQAALDAADPAAAVHRFLRIDGDTLMAGRRRYPLAKFDRIFLLGAGKASPAMAQACERVLGRRISQGLIITKYGHALRLRYAKLHEAGHPVPDEAGVAGARQLLELAAAAGPRDLVLFLISGGASALTPSPAAGISLAGKQETTRLLLNCAANIHEINTVRKHLSSFKGGQLARAAHPATVLTLALSDVIGDNLESIGSGPTVPDPGSFAEAHAVLVRYDLLDRVPSSVRRHLDSGLAQAIPGTPKPGDPCFAKSQTILVGSNRLAVSAAAAQAKSLGYRTLILSSTIEGETRDVARMHAAILREIRTHGDPARPPACILSGGETTVTIKGPGKGGRNQEFALAAAIDLSGVPDVCVLSGGTDGTDGPTDAAGGIITGATLARGNALGFSALDHLARNDSYPYLDATGSLLKTGPTRTNVMDVRILLCR